MESSFKDRSKRLPEQNVLLRSATEPQPVVYGTVKKSGVVAWMDTSGTNQQYLWFVVAIAGHEIDGYETVWINDTPIDVATEINGSGFVTKSDFVDSDGNNLVKISLYDGTQTTVDSDLNSEWGGYWSANHVGEGIAYAVIRLQLDESAGGNDPNNPDENVWAQGAPRDIKFTIRGKKVYDPRLDSTNGGTGTHRANDASTWAFSDNPVLCIRDYLTDERLGGAFPDSAIDDAVVITQANICEESVTVPDGSGGSTTQDRYTCNGYVSTADAPRTNIEKMLTSCVGALIYTGGIFKIYAGAYPATSHDIDETWLRGAVVCDAATARTDIYNAVRGTYVSADEQFKQVEFEPRTSSAYETSDGRRRWDDIDLPFTANEYTAQRIALTRLKKSRNQVVVSLQCNRKAVPVALWDTVTLSLTEFSYGSKTFRVIGWRWNPDGGVDLTLREEAAADWTYTLPELDEVSFGDPVPAVTGGPPPPTSLTATPAIYGGDLSWTNPNMTGISHVELWTRETNDRSAATLLARVSSDRYYHKTSAGNFYWVINKGLNNLYSTWEPASSTGGVELLATISPSTPGTDWGEIGGTLADQTDLNSALSGKEATLNADQKRKITISTSAPSGGADGDVWLRYS
jgi:hypothetical protein